MEKLKKSNAILVKELIPEKEPTQEELSAIGEHLKKRLETLHVVGNEISPDWENNRTAHHELNIIHGKGKQQIQLARKITLIWFMGYLKMASGIEDPAEWFGFSELPAIMLGTGSRLIL